MHLAIKSNRLAIVKAICVSNFKDALMLVQAPGLANIRGNINNEALMKLFILKTTKLSTPLMTAVDHGNFEIFKFLFDLMVHMQKTSGKCTVLTQTFDLKDIKQETVLLKAVRTN